MAILCVTNGRTPDNVRDTYEFKIASTKLLWMYSDKLATKAKPFYDATHPNTNGNRPGRILFSSNHTSYVTWGKLYPAGLGIISHEMGRR